MKRSCLSLLFLLPLGACSFLSGAKISPKKAPINYYIGDTRDLLAIRRVVVLPIQSEAAPSTYLRDLRSSLERALSSTKRFRVVPMPASLDSDRILSESERKGSINTAALVDLAKRYKIDGVVVTRVTNFHAYHNPILGLQTRLVSIHSGDTIWAVDALYDSSIESTRRDLYDYHLRKLAPEDSLHDWELIQMSPRLYGSYVTGRIVETLS